MMFKAWICFSVIISIKFLNRQCLYLSMKRFLQTQDIKHDHLSIYVSPNFRLSKEQVQSSAGELGALVRAYFECTQYVINSTLKTSKDRGFIEIMVSDQVTNLFYYFTKQNIKCKVILVNMKNIMLTTCTAELFSILYSQQWSFLE